MAKISEILDSNSSIYDLVLQDLADSMVYNRFSRIGICTTFKKSTLQRCIKAISDTTWEKKMAG